MPAPEKKAEEGDQKMEEDTKDTQDMDPETDSDLDDTVDILRAKLI